jgi:hypothetical protein
VQDRCPRILGGKIFPIFKLGENVLFIVMLNPELLLISESNAVVQIF